jgi:hypothetical protein
MDTVKLNENTVGSDSVIVIDGTLHIPLQNGKGKLHVNMYKDARTLKVCFGFRMVDSSGFPFMEHMVIKGTRGKMRNQLDAFLDEDGQHINPKEANSIIKSLLDNYDALIPMYTDLRHIYQTKIGVRISRAQEEELREILMTSDKYERKLDHMGSSLRMGTLRDFTGGLGYVCIMLHEAGGRCSNIEVVIRNQINTGRLEKHLQALHTHINSGEMADIFQKLQDCMVPVFGFALKPAIVRYTCAEFYKLCRNEYDKLIYKHRVGDRNDKELCICIPQPQYEKLRVLHGVDQKDMHEYLLGDNKHDEILVKPNANEIIRRKVPDIGWVIALKYNVRYDDDVVLK